MYYPCLSNGFAYNPGQKGGFMIDVYAFRKPVWLHRPLYRFDAGIFHSGSGETLLITVGIAARSDTTHFQLLPLVLVTGLGTFTCKNAILWCRSVVWPARTEKYGKYVFLTPARLEQSEAMFERFSWVTLLISRYIAVVRVSSRISRAYTKDAPAYLRPTDVGGIVALVGHFHLFGRIARSSVQAVGG